MKKNILIGLLITILLVCGIASALGQDTTLPAPAFSVTGTSFSRGELIPATLLTGQWGRRLGRGCQLDRLPLAAYCAAGARRLYGGSLGGKGQWRTG